MQAEQSLFSSADEPKQPIWDGLDKRQLVDGRSLQIDEFFFDADVKAGGHSHPTDEAGYIVSGRFEIQLGDESRVVGAGDAYSLPAGVPHNVKCLEQGSYLVVKAVSTNSD